jgi:hypothetical protein
LFSYQHCPRPMRQAFPPWLLKAAAFYLFLSR